MTLFVTLPVGPLPDPHLHDYYALFYLLGFGAAGALLLRAGFRQGYPWRPWLLLIAGTLLFFILGTKLIAGTPADWLALGRTGAWAPGATRSVLGGLLGAMVGAEVLRRALGFRDWRVYDAFALPFAVGLAVQGVGCAVAGCCFGTLAGPAELGVTYAAHTAPWIWQVARGLLSPEAPYALPVVPVQLMQVLLCGLIAGVLTGVRRSGQLAGVAGGEWLLAVGLFAAGRFGLEFWRDGAGDVVGAEVWRGLKLVQWGLAVGAAGALGTLAGLTARARRRGPAGTVAPPPYAAPPDRALPNLLVMVGLLALGAAPAAQLLTVPEVLVVRALLLPVLVLEGARWLRAGGGRAVPTGRFYPVPMGLLLGAAGLMSQVPPDSTRVPPVDPLYSPLTRPPAPPAAAGPPPELPAPLPAPYTTLSMGGVVGQSHQLYGVQSSCNPSYPNIATLPGYRQRQWNTAFGVARTWARPADYGTRTTTFGVDVSVGGVQNTSGDYAPNVYPGYGYYGPTDPKVDFYRYRYPGVLVGVSPYLQFDRVAVNGNRFRWGFGVQVGRLAYDYVDQPGRSRKVLPILLFELGRPRAVYLHFSTYHGLNGVGNGSWWLGMGHATADERVEVLAGVATPHSNRSTSLDLDILGTDENFSAPISWFAQLRLGVSPRWRVAASGQSNFNDATRLGASVHYRLGAASAPR